MATCRPSNLFRVTVGRFWFVHFLATRSQPFSTIKTASSSDSTRVSFNAGDSDLHGSNTMTGADLPYEDSSSGGLCSQCKDIMSNFGSRGNKGVPARSWRTLQLYCNLGGGYEEFPMINPRDWPARDVWAVSTRTPGHCSLCLFFSACATRMGISPEAILSGEKSLIARLVPYRFTIGLPSYPTPSSSPFSGTWASVTETRVLQLIKEGCNGKPRSKSADYHYYASWPAVHLLLPAQAPSGEGPISDSVDYSTVSEWLTYCQSTHQSCNPTRSSPLSTIIPGFQLIDCEDGSIIPAENMTTSTYVTLSYVWGSGPVNHETMGSSAGPPRLPSSSSLPKVISDAMEVARTLGYRYLWVDRYCIPQENSHVKHLQIQSMGRIYSLSDLTIIAAAGEDAQHGLPGVSSTSSKVPQLWTNITHADLQLSLTYFSPPTFDIQHSVWTSRGWTFQEALLSRRRLVFTDRNVFFQCRQFETVGPEPYPDLSRPGCFAMPDPVFPPIGTYAEVGKIWELVSEFSKRTLSYDEDTLNAMQGIFGVWRQEHGMSFLYGLPVSKHDELKTIHSELPQESFSLRQYDIRNNPLLRAIFWEDNWDTGLPHWASPSANPRRISFPSWTWAGWKRSTYQPSIRACGASSSSVLLTPDFDPVEVSFTFHDKTLNWISHKEEILRRSAASQFPSHLVIKAEVFDVIVIYDRHLSRHDSLSWNYMSPPFLNAILGYSMGLHPPKIPPGLFENIEGSSHHLLGIPLYTGLESCRHSVHILLLRYVAEDEKGSIFERVNCFSLWRESFMPEFWPPVFELRRREVRIR